ncbi:hypothetical protein HPP92_023397 [Vanilla planifolia]|uniref:Carbohydrate kinase PfkB domain-containing protein n=1 Tax=Vanilla planifolia TaxID=51239 RepID=A0A835UEQ8_VANPL|nr:hypothetical protein HPP92_023397 [Vanilla planifolia]
MTQTCGLALWPSRRVKSQMMSIWDQVDIVKISDVELEFLTGNASLEDDAVMTLWRPKMKLLVVTLGKDGCKYYTKEWLEVLRSRLLTQLGLVIPLLELCCGGLVKDLSSLQDEEKMREVLKFANAMEPLLLQKKEQSLQCLVKQR